MLINERQHHLVLECNTMTSVSQKRFYYSYSGDLNRLSKPKVWRDFQIHSANNQRLVLKHAGLNKYDLSKC